MGCAAGDPAQEPNENPDGGTVPDGGTGDTSTSDFAREMISTHNTVRISASPTPNPALPVLTWSTSAAKTAQDWANQCKWGHNANRGNLGENIYAAAPNTVTTAGVVQNWGSEISFYDYGTNSCAPGKQCGHYTQIVWRSTTQVGCARAQCNQNSPIGTTPWWFWVCNYSPPGNYVGQRPY
ncbi:SCP-like family protein [Hyalangium minutum]|uniref:SCP-like family protein n=1 Tax=Hyalangium minutum TaxID=394096 RepID=A0A085WEG2_9BACT|nr:SCP-like family protein [Hyalangium minutum]